MAFERVTARQQVMDGPGTAGNVIHLAAARTVEMMMVVQAGSLVSRRLARQVHRRQPAFIDQTLDRAIHRGDAQPGRIFLGGLKDLCRRKRTLLAVKRLPDGGSLVGLSFHVANLRGESG